MHFFPSWGCIAAHFLHSLSLIIVLTSSTNKKNSWRFILPNIIQIIFISYLHILYVIYLIVRRHMTDFWYLQCIVQDQSYIKIIMIKIKITCAWLIVKGIVSLDFFTICLFYKLNPHLNFWLLCSLHTAESESYAWILKIEFPFKKGFYLIVPLGARLFSSSLKISVKSKCDRKLSWPDFSVGSIK